MKTFKSLLFLLTPKERKRALLLLIMLLFMALLDLLGVASILPFITVLANPSLIETNAILNKIFLFSNTLGIKNNNDFFFALGIIVFAILVISLSFKALITYVKLRFTGMLEYNIGRRLVEGYLHQPYSWFLNRNSADLGKTILSEVSNVIDGGINQLLELIARSFTSIGIITLLIIVDPKIALITGLLVAVIYGLIVYSLQNYLSRSGQERLKNNELRYLAVNEAFGAAKEIKVGGLEQAFIKRFSVSTEIMVRINSSAQVMAQVPRLILEAIAFGGILLILLYFITKKGGFNHALPIISLYAFAGYRLMPAIQSIYASLISLILSSPSIKKLYSDIKSLENFNINQDEGVLSFNRSISLKNIHYNYQDSSRHALKDISLSIPAKSTVGLVGVTGSGKTTTVDIILGLLQAQKGTLDVDGKVITQQNLRSWQRSIGYVPQHIYLSDDTVASNIAFGLELKNISQASVERASRIANLHEFIVNELPKKYQTTIGERGVRLSGGQRQRIGIARALYHNPQVLILDEATSALDNETEKVVMDAVNNISKDITIILIAHRLNTVKKCDIIFKFDKGMLIGQGSYDKIINEKL
jgi:ABC-type multidrug transport system fused ATPase/permease subunit